MSESHQISHIGVIGGGRMGKEVFDICSRNGFAVTLYVRRADAAATLDEELLGALRRRAAKGGSRGEAAATQLTRLKVTTDLNELATCDLINENIAEDLAVKRPLLKQLEALVRPDCITTSDSSFLTPELIARDAVHPERILNLHFFYPTRLTSFVEVIPGEKTSASATERTMAFVRDLKVRPILCRSVPGFLVNRMIPAFYIEGVLLLEEGYFTAAEIDAAARSLLSMGAGPLEACDQIGLDLVAKEHPEFPDLWRQGWLEPLLLSKLVAGEHLGTKSGSGIYAYPEGKPVDQSASLPHTERFHAIPEYSRQDVIDRLYYNVVVEAFRQLDMQVGSEEDIDHTLKEVLGFRSGPIAASRAAGLAVVREKLLGLTQRFGERFAPRGSLAE